MSFKSAAAQPASSPGTGVTFRLTFLPLLISSMRWKARASQIPWRPNARRAIWQGTEACRAGASNIPPKLGRSKLRSKKKNFGGASLAASFGSTLFAAAVSARTVSAGSSRRCVSGPWLCNDLLFLRSNAPVLTSHLEITWSAVVRLEGAGTNPALCRLNFQPQRRCLVGV